MALWLQETQQQGVLIVAKCIVNLETLYAMLGKLKVLIVAKCIVNYH